MISVSAFSEDRSVAHAVACALYPTPAVTGHMNIFSEYAAQHLKSGAVGAAAGVAGVVIGMSLF